jgi:hypothetical protein
MSERSHLVCVNPAFMKPQTSLIVTRHGSGVRVRSEHGYEGPHAGTQHPLLPAGRQQHPQEGDVQDIARPGDGVIMHN